MGKDEHAKINETEKAHETSGKLSNSDEDKLMRSVLVNDKERIEQGKIIQDSINRGISSFNPSEMLQSLVTNYQLAEQIYGQRLIRLITGYDPDYVKRNIPIPEFRNELLKSITRTMQSMKDEALIDREGFTELGIKLSSLVMYTEELEKLSGSGFGKESSKKKDVHGEKSQELKAKVERYRDIAIRKTVKLAVKRGHEGILPRDVVTAERKRHLHAEIVYAIDSSGSMKGNKMEMAKKAGVALCYSAIRNKDKVGVIAFGSEIVKAVKPTTDFMALLREIASIAPRKQTDFVLALKKAPEMFTKAKDTKHFIILTDGMPNVGNHPEQETLKAVSEIRASGITVSLIGIGLQKAQEKLAKQITVIGRGRLYSVREIKELDAIMLREYEALN